MFWNFCSGVKSLLALWTILHNASTFQPVLRTFMLESHLYLCISSNIHVDPYNMYWRRSDGVMHLLLNIYREAWLYSIYI